MKQKILDVFREEGKNNEGGSAMKMFSAILGLMLILLVATAFAAEEEKEKEEGLSVSASLDYATQYWWRGQKLSSGSVFQPSVGAEYKGFGVNIWANYDSNSEDKKWNESDVTLSYATELGLATIEIGYIHYDLRNAPDTGEMYATLGYNVFLNPELSIFHDVGTTPSTYFQFGISHSVEIVSPISAEFSATASYLLSHDEEDYPAIDGDLEPSGKFRGLHDGSIKVAIPFEVAEGFTAKPWAGYVFPLTNAAKREMSWRNDGEKSHAFLGGVSLSYEF